MTRKEIISNFKGILPPLVTPFNRRGDTYILMRERRWDV